MMALAGHPLGITCTVLDPAADACAGAVAELIVGAYDSADGLDRLALSSDVVTFEFESVPAASAERLAGHVAVQPPPAALEVAQDRLHEKRLFAELGIETAPFRAIGSQAELDGGPLPGVLKTRRLGYDGKGQRVLRERGRRAAGVRGARGGAADPGGSGRVRPRAVDRGRARGGRRGGLLSAGREPPPRGDPADHPRPGAGDRRGAAGAGGALRAAGAGAARVCRACWRWSCSRSATGCSPTRWRRACTTQGTGRSRAPRPASSRTTCGPCCGLPLGSTALRMPCTMVNLIGAAPATAELAAVPRLHVHLYGKAPRPGRKVGHVTVTRGGDWEAAAALADAV